MNIRTLYYLVEVVRQRGFTRAAEKLFVTQPTISKMLKNLEDELNCILLIRDGHRLLLTGIGHVVFEHGLALLTGSQQLEAKLSDINQLRTGVLRLGISSVVRMLMARPTGLFRQCYSGVKLKISKFGDLAVQQAMMNSKSDMTLTILPVEESGLTTLPLFSHLLCVLTPHSGKWLGCDAASPETLAGHPLLIYNEDFVLNK